MAFGAPFYNYGANNFNGLNGGYMPQNNQPNYLYNNNQTMAQNAQNQPLNAFQQQQAQMAQQQANMQQSVMPVKTNMPLVTSLLDALNRTIEPNTNTYYADQDNPLIYLVSMDMQGRKTSRTFKVEDITEQVNETPKQTISPEVLTNYATKDDLKAFKDEITSYAMSFFPNMASQTAQSTQATSKPKSDKSKKATESIDEIKE